MTDDIREDREHSAAPGDDSRFCATCRMPITRLALLGWSHDPVESTISNAEARRSAWLREKTQHEGGQQ